VDLVLADRFADCRIFGAEGSRVRVEEVRPFLDECYRKPVEGDTKVVVGVGYDAITEPAAATLLKTVEEPGPSVVIVLLAEDVPDQLVTIASRCVRVNLLPLTAEEIRAGLADDPGIAGVDADIVDRAAGAAGGDLRRAKVLATDERFVLRLEAWAQVPGRLDGSGAAVVSCVVDLQSMIEESLEPLKAVLAAETVAADAEAETYGRRRETHKQEEDRHKRIVRRGVDAEYVTGLGILASVYRDAATSGAIPLARCVAAVEAIDRFALEMVRSPNLRLQLQALFLDLPPLPRRA
jgi:DNA polymerase-3 subunit delta'